MTTQIWHNPRCSKSRQTLALLRENGIEPEVVLYKETAPDVAEISAVLKALGLGPMALIRKNDAAFKALNLPAGADDTTLVQAMATHPAIIERPVVLHNGAAAIGRPPESVLALFQEED